MPTPADLPVRDAGRPGPPGGSWRGHSSRCSDDAERPQEARWVARDDRVSGHVPRHDAAGPDQRVLTDRYVRQNGCTRADGSALLHQRGLDFPVLLALQLPVWGGGAWVGVVDERHPVAYEDVVLDGHPFADERVAGNLAVLADPDVLLDLDKGTDLGVVADFTSVEIDELRQDDAAAQLDVGSDAHGVAHRAMARPRSCSDRSAASSSFTTRRPATPSLI